MSNLPIDLCVVCIACLRWEFAGSLMEADKLARQHETTGHRRWLEGSFPGPVRYEREAVIKTGRMIGPSVKEAKLTT